MSAPELYIPPKPLSLWSVLVMLCMLLLSLMSTTQMRILFSTLGG